MIFRRREYSTIAEDYSLNIDEDLLNDINNELVEPITLEELERVVKDIVGYSIEYDDIVDREVEYKLTWKEGTSTCKLGQYISEYINDVIWECESECVDKNTDEYFDDIFNVDK